MNPLPAQTPAGGFSFLAGQHNRQGSPAKEPFVKLTGAQLLIDLLEQQGIDTIAGVPGGAVLPLYESLGQSRIRHVLARHEQAAGFIAQGMARIRGRAGVCLVTSGPGVTNVVTALADARLDSVPLLCIAGQVPSHLIGTDAFQEVATLDIVRTVTKACYSVKSADDIPEVVLEAFQQAGRGRPGPVLIDVPKDVQLQEATRRSAASLELSPRVTAPDAASGEAYDQAAALISAAERPLLYCGGGVITARAQTLARQLAEQARIPVTTTLMAVGLLPHDHALHLGMLGMHGARYTNHAVEAADLLIAIGARFDDRATGDPQAFAPRAEVIHVDIDARELGKIRTPTLAIQDDAANALRELLQRLAPSAEKDRKLESWHRMIAGLKRAHPLKMPRVETVCSPYGIMRALGELLRPDAIVTTDVGQHQMWAAQALPLSGTSRWLTSGGLGTMGFGLPAAIGAALASSGTPVTCITGDGSLLMNVQELATLAELGLDVKIVLLDNAALGLVRQQQALFYGQRYVGSRYPQATDFIAIAAAFGIPGYDLGCEGSAQVLKEAMGRPGPALVRVPIAEEEQVLPMVPPGAANTDAWDHPVPGAPSGLQGR
jgi:acetolactate synthase I/II/III large subunit